MHLKRGPPSHSQGYTLALRCSRSRVAHHVGRGKSSASPLDVYGRRKRWPFMRIRAKKSKKVKEKVQGGGVQKPLQNPSSLIQRAACLA